MYNTITESCLSFASWLMLSEESAHCEDGVWVMYSDGQPKQGNMTQIKSGLCLTCRLAGTHLVFPSMIYTTFRISSGLQEDWEKRSYSVTPFLHTGSAVMHWKYFLFFFFLATRFTVIARLRLSSFSSNTSSKMYNQCEWVRCDAGGLLVLISMCEKLVWRFITTHFPHISSSHGISQLGVRFQRVVESIPVVVFGICETSLQ